jgi:hypothetical protein
MKSDIDKIIKPKNSGTTFDNTKGMVSLSKRKGSVNNNRDNTSKRV